MTIISGETIKFIADMERDIERSVVPREITKDDLHMTPVALAVLYMIWQMSEK